MSTYLHKLKTQTFLSMLWSVRLHEDKDGSEILVSRGSDKEPRKLTPRECASLQGFPKKFEPKNFQFI